MHSFNRTRARDPTPGKVDFYEIDRAGKSRPEWDLQYAFIPVDRNSSGVVVVVVVAWKTNED